MNESVDAVVIEAKKTMKNERQKVYVNISYTMYEGGVMLEMGAHLGMEPGIAADIKKVLDKYLIQQGREDLLNPSNRSY